MAGTSDRSSIVDRIVASEFNAAAHGLRGIAALMVVVAHILGGTARHVYFDNVTYVEAVKPLWNVGTFGVHLFFIISGFVILPSALRYRPGEFALRRGLRIYPLFFVLSVLFVALNAHTNAYPKLNNLETVVSGFLFINLFTGTEQLTPNAWSLSYEVCFYVLTCAVVHFTVRAFRPARAILAIGAAVLFVLVFPMALYFAAGAAIRVLHARGVHVARARWWEGLFLLLAIIFASRSHFEYRWADFANPVLLPIMLSSCLYFHFAVMPGSLTERLMGNAFLAYTGTISYSLYLVHPYVYLSLRKLFAANGLFGGDAVSSVAVFAIPVVLLSFAISHLVNIGLERWPYRWFFHQRIYREPEPVEAMALRERHA